MHLSVTPPPVLELKSFSNGFASISGNCLLQVPIEGEDSDSLSEPFYFRLFSEQSHLISFSCLFSLQEERQRCK